MKTYELPIARSYVSDWSTTQAVREILQNAIDSDSPFSYGYDEANNVLEINSIYSSLSVQSLLLGTSSKGHDNSKIGQFGEGYKIAMLVLTPNNKRVSIFNDGVVWEPCFLKSKQFGAETLHVQERRPKGQEPKDGLVFRIHDVYGYDIEQIRKTCLQMQSGKEIGGFITTPKGQILLDKPGEIYVGGLFVTTEHTMKYGYNFDPEEMPLDRDRKGMDSWNLHNATMKMWWSVADREMDRIIELIEERPKHGKNDLYYADFGAPEIVKEALAQSFHKRYPEGVPVKDKDELDGLLKRGFREVVYVDRTHHALIADNAVVKERSAIVLHQPSPAEQLQAFFDNKNSIWEPTDVQAFEDLIQRAKRWQLP